MFCNLYYNYIYIYKHKLKQMDIFNNKTQIFNDLEELSQLANKIDKQNEHLINYINK